VKSNLYFLSISALMGVAVFSGAIASHAGAQGETVEPVILAQSGRRTVGQINPSRPIQIEVINAGGVPITSQLTQPPTDERLVAPGNRVTFGSLTTSYLPTPIFFLAAPEEADIGLSLSVLTEGNLVRVVIGAALSEVPGSRSMTIDTNGAIYVF
jgi:hypothetical protein